MEVFRHARHNHSARGMWEACSNPDPGERLLAAGRLECALADEWADADGHRDQPAPPGSRRAALLRLACSAAALWLEPGPRGSAEWQASRRAALPWVRPEGRRLRYAEPEGFRFYGLRPDLYLAAADSWRRCHAGEAAWVIGLRSIGSTLGAVVAARLGARWLTLRPRGPSDRRRPWVTLQLSRDLREWPGDFLLVDEGPGLSGSSFGGVVGWLRSLGVEAERIALLPGWPGRARSLTNPYARAHWNGWEKHASAPLPAPAPGATWIGGGEWRVQLPPHPKVAVWAAHERPKYLAANRASIWKFCGLGAPGAAVALRSRLASAAGFAAPVEAHDAAAGWLRLRRMPAAGWRPCAAWAETCGRYLAWTEATFRTGGFALPPQPLRRMRAANLAALGWRDATEPEPARLIELDARIAAHEWGETAAGWVKFDGAEHGDDPFFPGPADIAWDLAAVGCEFGERLGAAVLAAYRRHGSDSGRSLAIRMHWHRAAYLAYRVGFCQLAGACAQPGERAAFIRAAAGYAACWRRSCRRQ